MTKNDRVARDGFNKLKRLTEGYVRKGGQNAASQITERPPAPAPLRAASAPAAAPKGEAKSS